MDRLFVQNYLDIKNRREPQQPIVEVIDDADNGDCIFVSEEKVGPKTTEIAVLERNMSTIKSKTKQLLKRIDALEREKNEKQIEFAKQIEDLQRQNNELEDALLNAPGATQSDDVVDLNESWTTRLVRTLANIEEINLVAGDVEGFFGNV